MLTSIILTDISTNIVGVASQPVGGPGIPIDATDLFRAVCSMLDDSMYSNCWSWNRYIFIQEIKEKRELKMKNGGKCLILEKEKSD
jgi:hypothetical protein